MSWLTPALRETSVDNQMNDHKSKFLANAATPNLAVTLDSSIDPAKFERFKELFTQAHGGAQNAGKTLFLGGGADVTLIGSDFRKMELNAVQGHGETRICSYAGVPPIIVGVSEGLASGTYSNYGQAVRSFGDRTLHTLWQNASGSLAPLLRVPSDARLWFDSRDVPFLRADKKDAAEIALVEAQTIRSLIDGGYEPDAVVKAVQSQDFSQLINNHTGFLSVQLQEPGADAPTKQEASA
jgi:phage portal protein BeeE